MSKIKELQKAIGSHPLLGGIIYWSFQNVDIPSQELEQAFKDYGLEFKITSISSRRALTKALSEMRRDRRDLMVEKIIEDDERAVYVIANPDIDVAALELGVHNLNAVIYEKDSRTIQFKSAGDEISDALDDLYYKLGQSYNSEDMSRLIKRYIKSLGCITLRDRGGVYFAPVSVLDEMNRLSELVGKHFSRSHFTCLGIVDTKKERKSVSRDFKREVYYELDTAAKDLVQLLKTDQVRTSSLENRLQRYRAIREKVRAYQDLLKIDYKKLNSKLDEAEDVINDLLR